VWLEAGPFDSVAGDSADVTLDFAVNDLPDGEIVSRFWFISSGQPSSGCNSPVVATINRTQKQMKIIQTISDGALPRNWSPLMSSDPNRLIVGGGYAFEVALYDRNPLSGELSWIETSNHPDVYETYDSAISPSGQHLYSVENSTNQLAVFEISDSPNAITLIQSIYDDTGGVDGLLGAMNVTISPDGEFVYVSGSAEDAVSVFSRDQVTGMLTFVEAQFNGAGGISGLDDPRNLAVSPDGTALFVIGQQANSMVVFDRDPVSGQLTYQETFVHGTGGVSGLDWPMSISVSHDGKNIYALAWNSKSICIFNRDESTGVVTFAEAIHDWDAGGPGLYSPVDIGITGDDTIVVVSGGGTLATFDRDLETGTLTAEDVIFSNTAGIPQLTSPSSIFVSPDGSNIYWGGTREIIVFALPLFVDGFESGDTTEWSASVP
jgi:6-phosphogluconolactonase (cycloisomerase 2 family)